MHGCCRGTRIDANIHFKRIAFQDLIISPENPWNGRSQICAARSDRFHHVYQHVVGSADKDSGIPPADGGTIMNHPTKFCRVLGAVLATQDGL